MSRRDGIGVAVLLRDDEDIVFVKLAGDFLVSASFLRGISSVSVGASSGSPWALRFRPTLVASTSSSTSSSTPAKIDVALRGYILFHVLTFDPLRALSNFGIRVLGRFHFYLDELNRILLRFLLSFGLGLRAGGVLGLSLSLSLSLSLLNTLREKATQLRSSLYAKQRSLTWLRRGATDESVSEPVSEANCSGTSASSDDWTKSSSSPSASSSSSPTATTLNPRPARYFSTRSRNRLTPSHSIVSSVGCMPILRTLKSCAKVLSIAVPK